MLENFMNLLFGSALEALPERQFKVCTDETAKTNLKYHTDIESLKKVYGDSFLPGLCIETTLTELLEICPRERRRKDAYTGLISYLKKNYDVELKINSQKKQKNF